MYAYQAQSLVKAVRFLVGATSDALIGQINQIEQATNYTFQVPFAFFWNTADVTKNRLPASIVTPLQTIGA
jgi:hypothetical protein